MPFPTLTLSTQELVNILTLFTQKANMAFTLLPPPPPLKWPNTSGVRSPPTLKSPIPLKGVSTLFGDLISQEIHILGPTED